MAKITTVPLEELLDMARPYFLLPRVLTCDKSYVNFIKSDLEQSTLESEREQLQQEYDFWSKRCKPEINWRN